jgi:hypothetical protein
MLEASSLPHSMLVAEEIALDDAAGEAALHDKSRLLLTSDELAGSAAIERDPNGGPLS